jgi:hypothetical protein
MKPMTILTLSPILAHPQGNRCLILGRDWGVWLEWDDDSEFTGPAGERPTTPDAARTGQNTQPAPDETEPP